MTHAKNIPEAIQWHEGMMLTPQHFQQLALRQEALQQYNSMLVSPYYWGVLRFELDRPLLVSGKVRVVELEAVMPDGAVVRQDPSWDRQLEMDLTEHKDDLSEKPMTVHLVIPVRKGISVKGDLARYESIEGDPVVDENTGESDARIPRLRPRASLILTEDPPAKYISLPLARVHYIDESYVLTDFLPPAPAILPGTPIHYLCKSIAERIREKAVYVSERTSSRAAGLGAMHLTATRHAVHCLVAGLPQFEAMVNSGVAHPFALYLSLCQLVGLTASLGRGLVPPALPPYSHYDIAASFKRAADYVMQMIREGVPESHTAYPLKIEDEIFSIFLEGAWLDRRLVLELRPRRGVSMGDLTKWGEESLIGTESRIKSMKASRVLGSPRTRVDQEEELLPSPGAVLFLMTVDREFIQANEVLKVLNTSEQMQHARPQEIVLYVRNE